MPDLFTAAAAAMDTALRQFFGEALTYIRGATEAEVEGMIGRSTYEVADALGVAQKITTRDFLIDAAALTTAGLAPPTAGDRIHRENQAGETEIYEVNAAGTEPPYRPADAAGTTLRIHVRRIATA